MENRLFPTQMSIASLEGNVPFWLEVKMNKGYPLLKRLVGGVKKNMSTIWFGLGVMVIPIAAYVMIEQDNGIIALLFFLMGVWAIIMALVEKHKEDKKDSAKFWTQLEQNRLGFEKLIAEIKGLRKDIIDKDD